MAGGCWLLPGWQPARTPLAAIQCTQGLLPRGGAAWLFLMMHICTSLCTSTALIRAACAAVCVCVLPAYLPCVNPLIHPATKDGSPLPSPHVL